MIMFMLLNRDLQWPYQFELDQLQNKNLEGSKKELVGRFTQQMKPTFSNNYCILQATAGLKVDEIFTQCTKFAPSDRPSVEQIVARLQVRDDNRSISHDIPLNVSQSTAVEGHDRLVAVSAASGGDILDDATNGCALLSVGIADQLMQEPTIVKGMLLIILFKEQSGQKFGISGSSSWLGFLMVMCHFEHGNPKLSTWPINMIGDEDLKLPESPWNGSKRHVTKVKICVICGKICFLAY